MIDWTYKAARRRLLEAARGQLTRHTASGRLDEAANRIVDCSCGWIGNGLGWASHLDDVVRASSDGGPARGGPSNDRPPSTLRQD